MINDLNLIVLSALEFNSIAIGIKALDEMVKIAPVNIIDARTICPGKYIIVFSGDVASVEYSFKKGIEIGGNYLVDKLYLPFVHTEVLSSLGKVKESNYWDAVGIIETLSVISSIEAADKAAKEADVKIIEIRLAIGFGGKSYIKLMGKLDAVEIAMEAGVKMANSKNQFFAQTVIPQPHIEIKPFFMK